MLKQILSITLLTASVGVSFADFEYYSNIDNNAYQSSAVDNSKKYPVLILANPNTKPLDIKLSGTPDEDHTDVIFMTNSGTEESHTTLIGDYGDGPENDIPNDFCSLEYHDITVHLPPHGACFMPYTNKDDFDDGDMNVTILNDSFQPTGGMTEGTQQTKHFGLVSHSRDGVSATIIDHYSHSYPDASDDKNRDDYDRSGYILFGKGIGDDEVLDNDLYNTYTSDAWVRGPHHENNNLYGRAAFIVYAPNGSKNMNELIKSGKLDPFVSGHQDIQPCTFTQSSMQDTYKIDKTGTSNLWMKTLFAAKNGGVASCVSKGIN